MKFVLNTVIDPHFCAIFSNENELINSTFWTERSSDAKNIYDFLEKQDYARILFCGGISGPGGFSSLRASADILSSISISNNIRIHQVSAEKFIVNFLGHENFLLNSFGDSVWRIIDGKISREPLYNIDLTNEWFVDLLPEKKRILFSNKISHSFDGIEKALLDNLLKQEARKIFVPHYEVAPV